MPENYDLIKIPVVPTTLPVGPIPVFDMTQFEKITDLKALIQAQTYVTSELARAQALLPSVTSGWQTFVKYCTADAPRDSLACVNVMGFRYYKEYLEKVIATYQGYYDKLQVQLDNNGDPETIRKLRENQYKLDHPTKDYTVAIITVMSLILLTVIIVVVVKSRKKNKQKPS